MSASEGGNAANLHEQPWYEVEVSDATYRMLERIARKLDCTVAAALEEVIREFKP